MQATIEFSSLFAGRTDAYGTGEGRVVRALLTGDHYAEHLAGKGPGLGVFPLRDDGTVLFGAIDLDEPDFELAALMRRFIPGASWIEQSRSGNAHVWVFFQTSIEAWVVRGVLREAAAAASRPNIEIFPKQDKLQSGMVGNYINLPYYGVERPIFRTIDPLDAMTLSDFLITVTARGLNNSATWRTRGKLLGLQPPEETPDRQEFHSAPTLHRCGAHMLANATNNPIGHGARHVAIFALAKMLLNWRTADESLAWELLAQFNAEGVEPPLPVQDVRRAFNNVQRAQYTSTGCDDPLLANYVDPVCPIAHG